MNYGALLEMAARAGEIMLVSGAEVYDSAPPGGTVSLWMEDLQRLLSEEEWEMLVRHIIWRESLKKFALRNHLTYATTKRHYAELKRKLREYYKEEKYI